MTARTWTGPLVRLRQAVVLVARILDPVAVYRALVELTAVLVRDRALVRELVRRDLVAEHRGKSLGPAWGFIQPLLLLVVYGVVYGIVFRVRAGPGAGISRGFVVYLLSGLVPWLAVQLSMAKATSLVPGNAALVKQVVFDMRIVPVASTLATCLPLVIGLGFVACWTLVADGSVPWTYALLPVVLFFQVLAMCGVAFALAAIGAFVRDIRDLVQLSAVILVFLLPIVYLPGAEPAELRTAIRINPWSAMVHCFQDVFSFGRIAHPWDWVGFALGSVLACAAGYRFYRRARPLFGDVV